MHNKCQRVRFNRSRNWNTILNLPEIMSHIINRINHQKYWWHLNVMETVHRWSRLSLTSHHNLNNHRKHKMPHNKWPQLKHHRQNSTWIERIGNHLPRHNNEYYLINIKKSAQLWFIALHFYSLQAKNAISRCSRIIQCPLFQGYHLQWKKTHKAYL